MRRALLLSLAILALSMPFESHAAELGGSSENFAVAFAAGRAAPEPTLAQGRGSGGSVQERGRGRGRGGAVQGRGRGRGRGGPPVSARQQRGERGRDDGRYARRPRLSRAPAPQRRFVPPRRAPTPYVAPRRVRPPQRAPAPYYAPRRVAPPRRAPAAYAVPYRDVRRTYLGPSRVSGSVLFSGSWGGVYVEFGRPAPPSVYVVPAPAYVPPPVHLRGRRSIRIPPGHLPPPGACRIWYPGLPPGHQPPPTDCGYAYQYAPANAFVVYGG